MNAIHSTSGLINSPIIAVSRRKRSSTTSLLSIPSVVSESGANSLPSALTPAREIRQRRHRPSPLDKNKIQREYQLLQSQTLFLVATASISFVLVLLFSLPLPALVGLTVMVTSLGALTLVAYAAVKTKYRIELQHPLGLIRHLPQTVQTHLTEKSLHSCLSPTPSTDSLASMSRFSNNKSLPQASELRRENLYTVSKLHQCNE